ncbi:ribonuclease R [Lachnobacterium bovis]|uniref:ribonuclease R n=1 Tax=Lachnobacterium bovis TaxID=140626 RepID=UPI0004917281|nr:ribonuclease R [Lachnobacterium bovis]
MSKKNKIDLYEIRKKIVYDFMGEKIYVPMKIKELMVVLGVTKEDRPQLDKILEELIAEGKIEVSKRGKYSKVQESSIIGTFVGNPRGFGFVEVDDDSIEDIFIPSNSVNGAINKDKVEVIIVKAPKGKRKEGKVKKIVERANSNIVCTYEESPNFGFAVPDSVKLNSDIFIPKGKSKNAKSGDKVVVQITKYSQGNKHSEGKVVEILGGIDDVGVDILSIIRTNDLPEEFPVRVENQAERVGKEVSEADMAGRMDLRQWRMITIDGEDAKDLDDAVSLTKEGNIFKLGVHIADVTNYVQEGSALDREAIKRGTSVYLVDRVIPMLPRALSNGICSLNQGENRLALSCIMYIDETGRVVDHKIAETVIKVDRRMSYTQVKKILERTDQELVEEYSDFVPMIDEMAKLAEILRGKRMKRGAIDFDFPETKVILDEKGKPIDIKPYERNIATKLIEDFMLVANETVATEYFWREAPFLYRTHEAPDPEKIEKLSTFVNNFGYMIHLKKDEVHPKEIQKLLDSIKGKDEEALICRLALRSMKQARYTTECTGHFGLAIMNYCHFTSPIRRYPDLQIHRIIKENLRGRLNSKRKKHYTEILPKIAKSSSDLERRAAESERETVKLKQIEFMSDNIGQEYEGVISGVTQWGIFVELANTVEGLVRIADLVDDFYIYDEEKYEFYGEKTGKTYKLGQKVKIKVIKADIKKRTLDFRMIE